MSEQPIKCLREAPEDSDINGWDGPGWYFWDESYSLHGPFETREDAEEAFNNYSETFLKERPQHLWEPEHQYYAHDSNYYNNIHTERFNSWKAFLKEWEDADLDYNLLVRWDWHEPDDVYERDTFQLTYVQQRKGIYSVCLVVVTKEDEAAVIKFLKPRLEHLQKLWAPLMTSERSEG